LHWQGNFVVLEIADKDFSEQDGYVAFQRGNVLFNGSAQQACEYLRKLDCCPSSLEPIQVGKDWENIGLGEYGIAVAGWDSEAAVGNYGYAYASNVQAKAGEHGVAISTFGEVIAGDFGCAWTRHGLAARAGHRGLARTNEFGTASVGNVGVAISEGFGEALAGNYGIAITDAGGLAGTGAKGVAFAREGGRVRGGEGSILLIRYGDEIKVARVGQDTIKPGTVYALDDDGSFYEWSASEP
jgi:hypothetical protein